MTKDQINELADLMACDICETVAAASLAKPHAVCADLEQIIKGHLSDFAAQRQAGPLTDAQCDEFRRHNGDFNAMVRAIFTAGCEQRQAGQEPVDDPLMPVIGAYEKPLVRQADAQAALDAKEAEIAALRKKVDYLTPYVEAFRREETRADKAERDADDLRQDANRYRWLRDDNGCWVCVHQLLFDAGAIVRTEKTLDSAIDASMQVQAIAQAVQP